VREEQVILEDHADAAPMGGERGDEAAVEQDLTRVRRKESGHQVERRGLSRPARAEQGDELARRRLQVDAGDRLHVAELLPQSLQFQGRAPALGGVVGLGHGVVRS
jgi:hypothetical protein